MRTVIKRMIYYILNIFGLIIWVIVLKRGKYVENDTSIFTVVF